MENKLEKSDLRRIIEALLFTCDGPLKLSELSSIIHEARRSEIKVALDELIRDYDSHGFCIEEVAGGYQLRTRTDLADWILRMYEKKPVRLSKASMETLAIIAYKQPVTRPEIDYIRGVDTGGVIKTLLERRLIKVLGRKDLPGHPFLYGTTKEFLEMFNLKSIRELPPLEEVRKDRSDESENGRSGEIMSER